MNIEILDKYKDNGVFSFEPNEDLKEKCKAPTEKAGIYLIYKIIDGEETLIYIGSSGQKKEGRLKVRKSGLGGMKDRIVNGYHPKFGKVKRRKIFPGKMREENIPKIKFYWWVTYDFNTHNDFPTDIEKELTNSYRNEFGCLPEWHK